MRSDLEIGVKGVKLNRVQGMRSPKSYHVLVYLSYFFTIFLNPSFPLLFGLKASVIPIFYITDEVGGEEEGSKAGRGVRSFQAVIITITLHLFHVQEEICRKCKSRLFNLFKGLIFMRS